MKIKKNNSGMTLTELIVATILISIIMVAVAAFSAGVKMMQDSSRKAVGNTMKLSTAMYQLNRDASLATGSAPGKYDLNQNPNSGIHFTIGNDGYTNIICFRHDQSDPSSYADDKWVCYINCKIKGFDRCEGLNAPVDACPANIRERFLGMPSNEFYTVQCESGSNATCSGAIKYIDFSLSTKHDFTNLTDEPMANPEFALTTRVYPLAHSQ